MATDNRGVMVYLPPDIEEYITSFCTEYNITRKDKEGKLLPSLGTGVVTYLKSKISGESPDEILTKPSKSLSKGLSKEEVLDLIKSEMISISPLTIDALSPIQQLAEVLREELSAVSEFARSLEEEIGEIKKALSLGVASPTENRMEIEIGSNANIPDRNSILVRPGGDTSNSSTSQPSDKKKDGLSKDERRWLSKLAESSFRAIIEGGISASLGDREIVDRLFAAGYGKNDNTEPYPHTLVRAMKKAYNYQQAQS